MGLSAKQKQAMYYLIKDPVVQQVFYGGAAFGGKSYLGCIWQINNRLEYPGTRGFICRASMKDIRNYTLPTFEEVYKRLFAWSGVKFDYNWRDDTIEFENGSVIYMKHLVEVPRDPDYTYLGSAAGADAWIEEVGEIPERGADILFSRIRDQLIPTIPGDPDSAIPKILYTGNPGNYWAKWRFVKDKKGNPVTLGPKRKYVHANLHDNPDQQTAKTYADSLTLLSEYDQARLIHGDWDALNVDRPFFYEYRKDKHMVPVELDRRDELWLSFDFNLYPCTCTLGQKEGYKIKRTIQVEGGTQRLCERIKEEGWHKWPGGIMVTGDSSGDTGSTTAGVEPDGRHITDYQIISEALDVPVHHFREAHEGNRRLTYSRTVTNYALRNLPIAIDPECYEIHQDLQTGQETPDGKLLKNRQAHKQDAGDSFRYMINAWFPNGIPDIDAEL